MSNVVNLPNKRDWKWHRDRIATAWGKQVPSIIETGQMLIEAKEELPHGSYEAMVQSKLPFVKSTARALKIIAEHNIISNRRHVDTLPVAWTVLYELTKLPDEILIAKLKDGSIHPKLERKDVRAMRPDIKDKPKPASRKPAAIEPQAQRDEMRRSYVTFLQTLTKEEQVQQITMIIRRELGWTTKEISLFLSSRYPTTRFKL